MSCIITRKSRASIRGTLHHCQTYMRHFNHRRKYTACSLRDSFAYSESRHDTYPQFPRSSLGTRGLQTRSHRQKKKGTESWSFLTVCKASSTKKTTSDNRNCPFCGSNQLEDEVHILFNCSKYSLLRNNFYNKVKILIPNITQLHADLSINELTNVSYYYIYIYIQFMKYFSACFVFRDELLTK